MARRRFRRAGVIGIMISIVAVALLVIYLFVTVNLLNQDI
jgi:Flp pilus assembly protein TadG